MKNINIIDKRVIRLGVVLRTITLLALFLLSIVTNKVWAADIKYHIINNDGKECFRYVIKGDYTYSSIDKTKLCVHPWARSVVATNFRFYVNKDDAVADANGTQGSYFTEGTTIDSETGSGPFYVRYSMKSSEELAAEGFSYDPEGNMTYLLQIRERNAKGGKRRQVYYDATSDKRFEFGSPGAKNTDIPIESLQKDEQYLFRVVSSDPYNTYFYNVAAEAQNPNGVLTVKDISRNNDKKAKESVTYETKISNYDPETTTTLQGFFFVAANSQILQSGWSSEYNGKMFVVGAVGGKDYWMRDVGSANSTGGVENYVPYMLCANGNLGNFSDPGFQLQCYQSWRNHDYNNDNTGLVLSTPNEVVHEVRYHIVNNVTKEDAMVIVQRHGASSPFSLANRDKLQRIGCTLSENYYSNSNCTVAASALVGEATDVYIPYTFNTTTDEIAAMTATGLQFSTIDNPKWFSLDIKESNTKLLTYDTSNNVIDSRNGPTDTTPTTPSNRLKQESQYAFIGDPYSFRIICKAADGQYAYVDPTTINVYGTNVADNVRFTDSPTDNSDMFAMVAGTTSSSFQIFQRDKYAVDYRAFWYAQGGGNRIRMRALTKGDEIIAEHNLHATPTPEYSYTYNIVDNSGHIAIKYTVTQEVSHRLDGEHGHKAIPSAIYSPYLEGETLTFYTTFTEEGNLETLSNPITQLPSGNDPPAKKDIYVRYTTNHLSEKYYPLDNTKNYFMQLGGRYVIHNGSVVTQVDRPSIEGADKENNIWLVFNQDPYNITVRNNGHTFNLLNNTDTYNTRFIIMNSEAATPEEGQIVLLFANGGDLSNSNSISLALSGESVSWAATDRSAAAQQIIFTEAVLERTYRLIDKQGKILLEYDSKDLDNDEILGVPTKWISPLVSTYHYWLRSNFTISGDVYTLKASQTEITSPAQSSDGYIYVTYDVKDNNIITQIDPTSRVHQNGSATGTFVRDYDHEWGQIFMIKFADGEEFYQERGDSLRETKMKAIYPYSNGDSGFNLYGETKWNEDKVSGSSTRTRWSWYVVSQTNDPYRVLITSWQNCNTRKLSGDDVSTSFYNYWRTYYNSEIGTGGSIVTATISDDPQVSDESKTGGSASNVPTEYMLLGTTGSYKLVTTNEIDNGVEAHATYGKHRPVKDFLQYWKTYETISRKGVKPKDGTALKWDEFQSQTQNSYSFFSAENVGAHPMYRFQAWQNARPIYTEKPDSSLSKKYEYAYHYYQKISLDETFDLVEHSIDGILILLDNHGWEIMRKPMAKTGDANKASRDADIRKFDSPMVKTYHFWSTADKTTGYHKYTNWQTEKGTGSSLADYPEVLNSNGNVSDLFVTYEVKPEYAELYTVTKNGSTVTGAVADGKTFIIRQDSKLAYDNSGALAADDNATNITNIDTGQSLNDLDTKYYWYLAPNWDIDKEMGYKYATKTNDGKEEEDVNNTSDGQHLPRTQTETEISYYKTSRAGFDPYNIQIYNQATSKYFTTNASDSRLDETNAMKATFTDKNVTLASHHAVNTEVNNGVGHDAVNLHMTNQTFMAVSDANGNLRLMPRFDHYHAIQNFNDNGLTVWATDQPEDDKTHGQSTWMIRPTVYTYIVVDSLGREALRYTLLSDGSPKIPAMFKSPLAEDFTFWKTLTADDGTHDYDYDLSTLANKISGSFADANLSTGGTVYVRYHYAPDADTDGLLKGTWYHAQLNGADVKVTTSGIAKEAYTNDNDHHWRFMRSAGDIRDPYAVSLYNGSKETESPAVRYILMKHNSGTGYALMQAGTKTTASYSFLDGTSAPTLAAQSNYTTGTAEPFTPAGTIDASKKLTLVPILATNKLTYKIITNSGKVALTSDEETGITDSYKLKLPNWMKSPLMKDDAYLFYSAADIVGSTVTIKGESTTSPTTLDGDVVYVRYDYEKSKKAVTSFQMPDLDGLPYNYAPLDLSGKVMYTIGISSNDNGKIWSVGTGAEKTITKDTETDVKVSTELTRPARLWLFTGNDPYEVTIQNPSTSTTAVLAGKTPDSSASDAATPNDKYPLVKLVATDDATYNLNTFMVLKANPNEVTSSDNKHRKGTLKLYVTGNDTQYLAESNSLAGGVYIYKDALTYKNRLEASGEPLNPKDEIATPANPMIIYSNFFYRPVLTYHIITNDKKEALKGYSLMAGTTVEIPEVYQSPLLNSSDFTYYTKATKEGSDYTVDTDASTAASTTIASLASKSIGDIYVRYTYSRANSPFKIATNIDDAAEDDTRLDWENEDGLDLSGDPSNPNTGGTWYTIADMQDRFNADHGNVFGVKSVTETTTTFEKTKVNELTNGRAPSNKEYLWKLMGDDPYAIRIYNAQHGQYLSVKTDNNKMSLQDKDAVGYYQTFMLLEAHGNDNEIGDFGKDEEGNFNYQLRRWTSLIASGTKVFTRVTTDNDATTGNLNARDWDFDNRNFSNYDIRMSGNEVVTRQILSMGAGGTGLYCVEFVKAPVSRKYHYHAIKYEGSTRIGQTWDAIMEHDWLQPVVLEDNIARLFCKYEMRDTLASGDNVNNEKMNIFKSRAELEKRDNAGAQVPNAQFYSNEDLTKRVKDDRIEGASGQYDVYPEIELDDVYHIYFKYQIDNTATVSGRKLSDITSTTEQIANDKAHYAETGRLDPAYYTGDGHGKWFFMVLDTDAEMTATGEEDSRTYTGNQYFLRREDNGTVSWMNNSYTLHPQAEDNYNDWKPSRVAEWYKKGDNDPYREGRWLWTFVGTDPYNMQIVNMESVVGVNTNAEGVYSLAGADNCWTTIGQTTLSNGATAYPVTVPTEEPTENQYWGISNGYGTEGTMSLISTAITLTSDNDIKVNQPLYWNMLKRTINKVTTQSVEGSSRSSDRSNAIQLILYEPVKYQDINLVIKREDHVVAYNGWKAGKTPDEKRAYLKELDSGISLLYFTAAERTYVADDKIDLRTQLSLPINVRRAFCKYTLYKDDFTTEINEADEDTYYYTVTDGPYPTTTQATTTGTWSGPDGEGKYTYSATGDKVYDEDGKPVWTYTADGTLYSAPAPGGAQSIYVKYEVTSDIFLKTAPTKTQVEEMAQNNDHVYFMDFPTYDAKGNEITHHAFYDPEATTFIQTGDLSRNKDKNTGIWIPEKKTWSSSDYVSDFTNSYNATQYRTADDRLVSTPDKLKWYFVGDPYKLQVFSTAGAWNGDKQAQLARFNTVETNFKFVSDCVHIRLPNYENIDNRPTLIPTNEYGVAMPEKAFPNRNNGKPYVNDFYWECVPAASKENGTFALRFKEDNDLLGYRNVYYYLGRDGKTMVYNSSEENPEKYHINLNYRPNNERYESGEYLGYHRANNDSTIIRLVQPVKVYITTNRAGDDRYSEQTNVTVDEYSGYYGLGETITGVPRHLQRKYVGYNDLTHNGITAGTHNLTIGNATSSGTCGTAPYTGKHSQTINDLMTHKVSKEPVNAIFKFSVYYNVDDMTADGIHLFSSCANPTTPLASELTWLDMMVGSSSWFYYDKTNVDGNGVEDEKSRVSNYRRALSENKSGWNNDADGWNDGLKGLHWAFVGDPYDFTILNRRRYEDAIGDDDPMWLAATKNTIANYDASGDSIVWAATLMSNNEIEANEEYSKSTSTAIAGTDKVTHWSLQMWKLGNADYYFLRTASLDKTTAGTDDSETDNYWRMMAKQNGTNEFYAEPYALDDHNRYTNNKNNLNWGNYVTNDMRYSKTMNSLGVYEQRLQIRTAVAEDKDKADNDCFDAKVEIRTKDGTLRISKDKLEIKYGLAPDMLPYTLRRYGCEYTCYVNYDEGTKTGDLLTRLRDSATPMDESESVDFANSEYTLLSNAITAAKAESKNVTLTYIYEVADSTAQYFTTASDALTEDYTWTNTYFAWDQTYSGTNVEVEYYVDVFDHYVYDANGQIIDAVYIKERRTRVVTNPTQAYPTTAYLNTHTNQVNVFADESTQSKDDRQKWALVGDPYGFTMKNYAQYLVNNNATQLLDKGLMTQTTIPVQAQRFAIGIDENGNSFLSVIDSNGEVITNMSFTFSTSSDKTVNTVGTGVNNNDPTGHTYDTDNVKPFKLANLLSYADIVQYHLVIAHQHSLDPDNTQVYLDLSKADNNADVVTALGGDATKIANRANFKNHLLEYLMYQGIQKRTKDMYVNLDEFGKPTGIKTGQENNVKTLLKQNASLRDFLSYPITDYSVSRVGIGNHPQVPWYMKRQFCRYFLYQSDVMRSEIDNDSPALEVADAEWGSSTIEIDGVEYKINPSSPYAVTVIYYNGKFYLEGHAPGEGTRYEGLIQRTFEENGVINRAYNIKWISIFDQSKWDAWTTDDDTKALTDPDYADRKIEVSPGDYKKAPKNYKQALALQGTVLDRLQECHYNRMVKIDVVYEVIPEAFQFAYRGRNTTAWYQMMTNNSGTDYLMNFSYQNHIGLKAGRDTHYTNDYLWAPEGDPYGFVLRSRYSTINGNGFNATAVTTPGELPKKGVEYTASETASDYEATYTHAMPFISRLIIHTLKGKTLPPPSGGTAGDDSMSNGIYEMFTGDATFGNSFLMHPTTAYIDTSDPEFSSYYMMRDTDGKAKLKLQSARTLQNDNNANWYLSATTEQLLPYFERAGYVGGISPARVAANFNYQDYYDQLKTAKASGTTLDFSLLRKIQETVYDGTFKDASGATVSEGTERAGVTLPLTFVSTNLVNMTDGYYRIAGFSTAQLNAYEKAHATTGHEGIQGQRYISGYRFKSELDGSKPLRFFETTKDNATIHTFADLDAATPFTAEATLRGNIELLPADFDPSSIFRIQPTGTAAYNKYTLSTQGLNVQASAGNAATMSSADGTALRLDDIGGAAVTLRYFSDEPASASWDASVVENIKTNYLTSTGDSYSISMAADNELNETTDGIQDTKWLLQPVGIHEDWPYNEIPLRVEVNKGGVKNYALTGDDLTAPENQDNNYYGTLYVPFDTRLSNTTDAAFTLTKDPEDVGTTTTPGKVTMASVSRLNDMGNPQFVPAAWPVVLRTSDASNKVKLVNEGHTEETPNVYINERHYVNLYIPNITPTVITGALDEIKLSGQYLEKELTTTDLSVANLNDKTIMVFGLPFEGLASHSSHEYETNQQVGWFTNDNWAREDFPLLKAHTGSYAAAGTDGTVATDAERNNKYVYHNKVYYVLNQSYTPPAMPAKRRYIVAIFDGEEELEELEEAEKPEEPEIQQTTDSDPWPCDVFDLQGRRVAVNETPQTLRHNHPGLPKGVYIFGRKKVIVK